MLGSSVCLEWDDILGLTSAFEICSVITSATTLEL